MDEIKNAGFKTKTGIQESLLQQSGATQRKAGGGRPLKTEVHPFVAGQALAMYVGFLKKRAPKNWRDRDLNLELFSPEIDKTLPGHGDPFNGIGKLLNRRSLPRLGEPNRISQGIRRAGKIQKYESGLQIIFHPYVAMLSRPATLDEIHGLLTLCKSSEAMNVIRYSAFGATRNYQSFDLESNAIDTRIAAVKADAELWNTSFLDLVALAIGLTIESELMRDATRLEDWRVWWKEKRLLFADWPFGDLAEREKLDRWIELLIEGLSVPYINPILAGFEYLTDHVIAPRIEAENPVNGTSKENVEGFEPEELVEMFLSIRDGRLPKMGEVRDILNGKGQRSHESSKQRHLHKIYPVN